MECRWLRQESADELLIFFNGWGMDERIGEHLLANSLETGWIGDMLICYNYSALRFDNDVMEQVKRYKQRRLIAWSFGVWAAQQIALPPMAQAVAINGTLHPIDAEKGIRAEVFQATLAGWSEENRHRFNRRMCGSSEALALFTSIAPNRSANNQQQELARLQQHVQATTTTARNWNYSHAILGERDLIFPLQQQKAAWAGTPQTIIDDMPHFPFLHFTTIQELLACLSR